MSSGYDLRGHDGDIIWHTVSGRQDEVLVDDGPATEVVVDDDQGVPWMRVEGVFNLSTDNSS